MTPKRHRLIAQLQLSEPQPSLMRWVLSLTVPGGTPVHPCWMSRSGQPRRDGPSTFGLRHDRVLGYFVLLRRHSGLFALETTGLNTKS
jgi:hypothetical protein